MYFINKKTRKYAVPSSYGVRIAALYINTLSLFFFPFWIYKRIDTTTGGACISSHKPMEICDLQI